MVLSKRLNLWYQPDQEQAGAQPGRGCDEQILTLRLLIDIALHKRRTLYLAFIDYKKAYDLVDRHKLLQRLDRLGCGTTFLAALQKSMKATGVIGMEQFHTSAGVKQGGSTSCTLFTLYVNETIRAVNATGRDDGLRDLHFDGARGDHRDRAAGVLRQRGRERRAEEDLRSHSGGL